MNEIGFINSKHHLRVKSGFPVLFIGLLILFGSCSSSAATRSESVFGRAPDIVELRTEVTVNDYRTAAALVGGNPWSAENRRNLHFADGPFLSGEVGGLRESSLYGPEFASYSAALGYDPNAISTAIRLGDETWWIDLIALEYQADSALSAVTSAIEEWQTRCVAFASPPPDPSPDERRAWNRDISESGCVNYADLHQEHMQMVAHDGETYLSGNQDVQNLQVRLRPPLRDLRGRANSTWFDEALIVQSPVDKLIEEAVRTKAGDRDGLGGNSGFMEVVDELMKRSAYSYSIFEGEINVTDPYNYFLVDALGNAGYGIPPELERPLREVDDDLEPLETLESYKRFAIGVTSTSQESRVFVVLQHGSSSSAQKNAKRLESNFRQHAEMVSILPEQIKPAWGSLLERPGIERQGDLVIVTLSAPEPDIGEWTTLASDRGKALGAIIGVEQS